MRGRNRQALPLANEKRAKLRASQVRLCTRRCVAAGSSRTSALYRKPRTSQPNRQHWIYPYLLKDLSIERSNQVWAADITYLPMARGFGYLVAIIDPFSRKVLAQRPSNTMNAGFCVAALEEALARCGRPAIFNADQGAQFTDTDFTDTPAAHGIAISMDGKGRWIDRQRVHRAAVALGQVRGPELPRSPRDACSNSRSLLVSVRTTFSQSPTSGCRKSVAVGYQGVFSPSRPQR